ncbi:N-acetyllactosaminide beta-1,3-N-acetylglucosaminyltransferase 2-like [Tiliqua scincoides]|uniref:N-acetyllactosaminide beta-1,3-N-acetylglucosaminyltransferase 2-like n=1 Tax=Tiliqua scincoides TaxID=71010 RepID=UPI003461928C
MRAVARARARLLSLLVVVNFLLYVVVELLRRGHEPAVIIPRRAFWKSFTPSRAYWNRRQQTLERLYNPILAVLSNTTVAQRVSSEGAAFCSCHPDLAVASEVRGFKNLPNRFQDFLRYYRCRDYPLLMDQPHKCSPKAPFLLLAIKSAIPHIDRRQAIRKSWGKEVTSGDFTIARVFLLGQTPPEDNFPDLSDLLQFESQTHRDILLWDYKDTFFNLTLKEVLFLKWATRTCPGARFVFKGDDDVFVNTYQVLDYLKSLTKSKAENLFIGDVIKDARPKREKKLKYYIPETIYRGFYPPYAGGGGYLYSGKLVPKLTNISDQVLLYPIDDVYTGMCLRKLGLAPEKHRGFKTFDIKKKHRDNICNYTKLILVHSRKPQEIVKIWKHLQDPHLNC